MSEHEITVLDVLERSCKRAPSSVAIALPDKTVITYEELVAKSKRAGAAIAAANKGDVVALFFPMLPEFVIAYLGALYANKCVLPLNLLLPPEEMKWILADA